MSDDRDYRISLAKFMWGGFHRCPTTGRVITSLQGDDKALCNCGKSNPACWQERTELTGVHIVRYLDPASAGAFVDQEDADRARARTLKS